MKITKKDVKLAYNAKAISLKEAKLLMKEGFGPHDNSHHFGETTAEEDIENALALIQMNDDGYSEFNNGESFDKKEEILSLLQQAITKIENDLM